jgi:hypothetical protein
MSRVVRSFSKRSLGPPKDRQEAKRNFGVGRSVPTYRDFESHGTVIYPVRFHRSVRPASEKRRFSRFFFAMLGAGQTDVLGASTVKCIILSRIIRSVGKCRPDNRAVGERAKWVLNTPADRFSGGFSGGEKCVRRRFSGKPAKSIC